MTKEVTMGILINVDEAFAHVQSLPDGPTRTLVNMALMHLVKEVHLQKRHAPSGDLDLLFLARSLEAFFSDPTVIARAAAGEKVGAWYEDTVPAR
jgi:hypothetical protein